MPISIPDGDVRWLLKLVVSDTDTRRWVLDGDAPVVVAGDGTYEPNGPVLAIDGFDNAGERVESRRWTVVFSDPSQTWFKTTLARRWRNRRVDLWSRHGSTIVHRKTGYLLQRVPVADEREGFQLNLVCGGLIDRVNSVNKRFTNPNSQRALHSADTSMDYAQTELEINWGGNL